MAQRQSVWPNGLRAVAGAVIGTLAVWAVAFLAIDVPPEFIPLAGPGPTVFFTVAAGTGAVAVFGLVRRFSANPVGLFRGISWLVLLFSFMPDIWLLTDGAAEAFPGATPAGVGVLMTMHVVAAGVIVWVLTGGTGTGEEER